MGSGNSYPNLIILEALYYSRGNVQKAAEIIGCCPATIYARISRLVSLKNAKKSIKSDFRKTDLQELIQNLLCEDYPSDNQRLRTSKFERSLQEKYKDFDFA